MTYTQTFTFKGWHMVLNVIEFGEDRPNCFWEFSKNPQGANLPPVRTGLRPIMVTIRESDYLFLELGQHW